VLRLGHSGPMVFSAQMRSYNSPNVNRTAAVFRVALIATCEISGKKRSGLACRKACAPRTIWFTNSILTRWKKRRKQPTCVFAQYGGAPDVVETRELF